MQLPMRERETKEDMLTGRFVARFKSRVGRLFAVRPAPPTRAPQKTWHECSIAIYERYSPLCLRPAEGVVIPELTFKQVTDVSAEFLADPFMIQVESPGGY